jgi:outer membrane lipoprotein-sorting protein
MTRTIGWVAAVLVAAGGVWSVRGESLEEVEKKLIEIIGKQKSVQYKCKTDMTMEMAGFKTKSESLTTIEYARAGERWKSRIETKSKGEQEAGGSSQKFESVSLMVFDGEVQWTLVENMGVKHASKQKFDPKTHINPFDAKTQFAKTHEVSELKLLPDEKVGGRDCWVIEMTPKGAANLGPMGGKTLQYYDKSNGVPLKVATMTADGKPMQTTVSEDIKIDGDIPAERFKFKAPDGVEIKDTDEEMKKAGQPTQP